MGKRKTSSTNKIQYKQSPYTLVCNYILQGDDTIELTDDILSSINLVSLTEKNFSNCGKLTVYLNEYFNNMSLYSLNKREFIKYLRYCYKLYKYKK